MLNRRLTFAVASFTYLLANSGVLAADMTVDTPMQAPTWAVLERQVLKANAAACEEFYEKYVDSRGYLECVLRWGGDDGPDDAIECFADWPLLYALGADASVLQLYQQAWEGHLKQYTEAKTIEVEFARDGMYFEEFPVTFDWVHHGEGLTGFVYAGLADPGNERYLTRARRFAGLYMNDDPRAENYDPQHRIIRSLFNGSRGPLLRKATALDWAGDPIEVAGRFQLRHGERSYEEMLAHFEDYNDIVGDHPQNLCATSLPTTAYLLTGEEKYRQWVLNYVDAWLERMEANGGIIPTNIGLDGTIGGACDGKWYGGVYGWGFSVTVPQTGDIAHRNTHHLAIVGLGHAMLLSGNQKYSDAWRTQIEAVNANAKQIDGQTMYPRMYGDDGWYAYNPQPYSAGSQQVYYWSMNPKDLGRLPNSTWEALSTGLDPQTAENAFQGDLKRIDDQLTAIRNDETTPDTRLADDPLMHSPATPHSLVMLTLGGFYPGHTSSLLHTRVRYFDPARQRPGLPDDVAALVQRVTADEITLTLVNLNDTEPREVIVQGGSYGEHQIQRVTTDERSVEVDDSHFSAKLMPAAGATLTMKMKRYANQPTLRLPWD